MNWRPYKRCEERGWRRLVEIGFDMCARIALLCVLSLITTAASGPSPQGRLVDGQAAAVGSHPYSASLQRDGTHICSATLIGQQHALTAAHCVTTGSGIER